MNTPPIIVSTNTTESETLKLFLYDSRCQHNRVSVFSCLRSLLFTVFHSVVQTGSDDNTLDCSSDCDSNGNSDFSSDCTSSCSSDYGSDNTLVSCQNSVT